MKRYSDNKKNSSRAMLTQDELKNVQYTKYKIIVASEDDKIELKEAFKHFHDQMIDTDIVAVNQLAHEYQIDNNIIVDENLYNDLK